MKMLRRSHLAAALLLAACASGMAAPTGHDTLVEQTARFAFHSDPRMSLHHFLYLWVTGEPSERVPRPHGVALPSKAWRERLTGEEAAAWDAALDHYRRIVAGRPLLFDRGLVAFKTWLRQGGELRPSNQTLLAELEKVEAIYRRLWWPEHDRGNRAWLRDVLPHVRRLEQELCPQLAAVFGGTWPVEKVRVDLVPHAHELTAYTTWEPHVTISTAQAAGEFPASLELVFHEPCHADTLQGAIDRALRAAEQSTGLTAPRDLWHVLLFQTTGLLVQDYLRQNGHPNYHRLVDGVAARVKSWPPLLAAVDRHWTPVVRAGGEGRADALAAILRTLAAGQEN